MVEEILKEKKEKELENVFLEEEKTPQKNLLRLLVGLFFISFIFSFIFLFQWQKTEKKLKTKEKETQGVEKLKEDFSKEKEELEKRNQELKENLEEVLKTQEKVLEWEEFNAIGLNFFYPKKWGKLTITSQKNNIFEFQAEDKNIDIVYYFKDSNALVFLERLIEHYNLCATTTPYYDKALKIIFPDKRIIPFYYIAGPAQILDCSQITNNLALGIINAVLFFNDQYLAFLAHGQDWSIPKIINIKTGENILEKTGQQFWFDPWEDLYFLEDGRIALTTFDLFPSYSSYRQPPFAPKEIAIYLSEPNNPQSLNKVHSVSTEKNQNLFFGNLEIRDNKLYFFLFQGSVNPITRKRVILTKERFVYDLSTQKVEEVK